MEAEVGDIIRVTSSVFDITQETFKIQKMVINPDGTVGIEARQHTAATYPFVPGATIEIPPPVFKPDTFSILPLQKTTRTDVPLQVRQPSQGAVVDTSHVTTTPTVPLTENNTLPQTLIPLGGSVNTFSTFTNFGTSTTSAVTGQVASLHTQFCNFRSIKISDSQFDCSFSINPPADPTIDQLIITHYDIDSKAVRSEIIVKLNNNATEPNVCYVSNVNATSFFYFEFTGTGYSGRADDGSTGTYSAQTYRDIRTGPGSAGKSLKAVINSELQAQDFTVSTTSLTTNHNIGTA
jgi:hypothetical protein